MSETIKSERDGWNAEYLPEGKLPADILFSELFVCYMFSFSLISYFCGETKSRV